MPGIIAHLTIANKILQERPELVCAVSAFYLGRGLVADGIAGAATFAKMTGTYLKYQREYRPCNECPNS